MNSHIVRLEPIIYTLDIERSISFYKDLLGFEIIEYYPNKENPSWVCFLIGESRLQIGKTYADINHKLHPRGIDGSGIQFYIKTENVNERYEKLREKVEIIDEIEDKSWGDREFTFKDPNGYLLSFYTKIRDLEK